MTPHAPRISRVPRRWTIEIICTDRGQHKRTWMTRMIWDAPWTPTEEQSESYRRAMEQYLSSPAEVDEMVRSQGKGGWHSFIPGSPAPKHDMYGPPVHDAEPGSVVSREAYGFACSRCTRWPKINGVRWIALMEAARGAGVSEFDVSYLD